MIEMMDVTVTLPVRPAPFITVLGALFPLWFRAKVQRETVLSGITFFAGPGEGWWVSGTGAAAFVRLSAGRYAQKSGRCRFGVHPYGVFGAGEELIPAYSGRENAWLLLRLNGMSPKAAKEKLPQIATLCELTEERFKKPVSEYSMAERAGLALSVALAQPLRLLVLSRCLELCAPGPRGAIVAQIKALVGAGGCLVLESGDPALAARLCTHSLTLKNGRVAAAGSLINRRASVGKAALTPLRAAFAAPLTPQEEVEQEERSALWLARAEATRLNQQLTAYARANTEFAEETKRLEAALLLEEQRAQQLSALLNRLMGAFTLSLGLLHEQFQYLSTRRPPDGE